MEERDKPISLPVICLYLIWISIFTPLLPYFKALANNIQGDFYVVNGIEIFVLNVFPSKDNPVFIEGINGKEFFVRLMASSEPFTDVEQIVMYCLDRWKSSKA